MKYFLKNLLIFCFGFTLYMCIEGVFKSLVSGGRESFTMGLLGGFAILFIGYLNNWFTYEMPLALQALLGAVFITCCELTAGIILNMWLGLGIWSYENQKFNILGQICLPFSIIWYFLSFLAIFADDFLRYYVYKSEKPHYHLFRFGHKNDSGEKLFKI